MSDFHVVRVSGRVLYGHDVKSCKAGCANPVGAKEIGKTPDWLGATDEVVGRIVTFDGTKLVSVSDE